MMVMDTVPNTIGTQVTADVLRRLIRKPVLVRILRLIEREGSAVYTRRLLALSGSNANHRRLYELAEMKLIRRVLGEANNRPAIWNEITPLGRRALELIDALDLVPADLLTETVTNRLGTQAQSAEVSQPKPWEDESIPSRWRLLLKLVHGPATAQELAQITIKYRARISDLRKLGLEIVHEDGQYILRTLDEARRLLRERGVIE